MGKLGREEIQGSEIHMYLQAPTEAQIDNMISDLKEFSRNNHMYSIEVSDKQPDPDGGWEAEFKAHNFNPFKWLKRRKELKGKSETEKIRLRQYHRREDNAAAQIKRLKKEKKAQEKQRNLLLKAEREDTKARIEEAKYNRRAYRGAARFNSKKTPVVKRIYRPEPSRGLRISPRERPISPRERAITPKERGIKEGYLWQ